MREKSVVGKGFKLLLASLLFAVLFGMTSMAAGSVVVNVKKVKEGVYTSSGSYSEYKDIYNKIVLKKPCEIAVTGNCAYTYSSSYGSLLVTLLNSNFKPLEKSARLVDAEDDRYAIYGLSAGTYYIKVSSEKIFALTLGVQAVADVGGSFQTQAVTIPMNKSVKGLIRVGEKAAKGDWYKFKVTKSKVLELTIAAEASGYFDFYLRGPSYPKGIKVCTHKDTGDVYHSVRQYTNTDLKIKPGIYYIKVMRASYDPQGSGVYAIKWNLR